ncbi:MAG: transcriptional repressor LexA [Actinomycetota bacterium]
MIELTKRQRAIMDYIEKATKERGFPPSVREIGEAVGLASPSSVHAHLETLEREGYLMKDPNMPRALVMRMDTDGIPVNTHQVEQVPLIGTIAAGGPILAQENVEDSLPFPRDLVGSGTLFALRVKGDSMINAGILDGDLVILRQQSTANDGEIVAALVDESEATVKRLMHKRGKLTLMPENESYDPIVPENARILGKLVAVFRSHV